MVRRFSLAAILAGLVCLGGLVVSSPHMHAAETVPARLSDRDFWKLVTDFSEPNGNFRSDNLLSNEIWFQQALRPLARLTRVGGAYVGVGPEQNFTYITALKPSIAFIVDIRRGNLDLHLMYKALFEISRDRADFVSRLFSRRPRPGLTTMATPVQLFEAFTESAPAEDLYMRTRADIRRQLVDQHHFALSDEDLNAVDYVLRTFYMMGPGIRYAPVGSAGGTVQPTYAELMAVTDEVGVAKGFLANEALFAEVKDYERRNLIVPVVGNFSGPKAIRAVGKYLSAKGAFVSAFYVSNVEEYLIVDSVWNAFCANVQTLPLDGTSTFIRSIRTDGPAGFGTGFMSQLRPMKNEVKDCTNGPP